MTTRYLLRNRSNHEVLLPMKNGVLRLAPQSFIQLNKGPGQLTAKEKQSECFRAIRKQVRRKALEIVRVMVPAARPKAIWTVKYYHPLD